MASISETPRLTRSPSTPIYVKFFVEEKKKPVPSTNKRCVCSPTTHPGSFRCKMHRRTPTPVKFFVEPKKPITAPKKSSKMKKKVCVCSPTTHPGSFRCSMHRMTPRVTGAGDETVTIPPTIKLRRSVRSKSLESIHS